MIETAEFVFWASGATVFCLVIAASMARLMDVVVTRARAERIRSTVPQAMGLITLRDGIERPMILDLAAICEIETKAGKSLAAAFADNGMSSIRDFLLITLRRGGAQLDGDSVAGLMEYERLEDYAVVITGLMQQLTAAKH